MNSSHLPENCKEVSKLNVLVYPCVSSLSSLYVSADKTVEMLATCFSSFSNPRNFLMFVLSKQLLKMRAGQEEEGHHRRRGATEFFLPFPPSLPSLRSFDFLGMQPVRTLGHDGRSHVISIPPSLFSIPRESKRKTRKHLMGTESHKSKRSHVELHPYYY